MKTDEDELMMISPSLPRLRLVLGAGVALVALAACDPDGTFDPDLRNFERSALHHRRRPPRRSTAPHPTAVA
ncbi:MAG: hypothetical protein R3D78_03155 [Paracoccaceae bacterium]